MKLLKLCVLNDSRRESILGYLQLSWKVVSGYSNPAQTMLVGALNYCNSSKVVKASNFLIYREFNWWKLTLTINSAPTNSTEFQTLMNALRFEVKKFVPRNIMKMNKNDFKIEKMVNKWSALHEVPRPGNCLQFDAALFFHIFQFQLLTPMNSP